MRDIDANREPHAACMGAVPSVRGSKWTPTASRGTVTDRPYLANPRSHVWGHLNLPLNNPTSISEQTDRIQRRHDDYAR